MSEEQFRLIMQAIKEMSGDIKDLKQDVSGLKQDVSSLRNEFEEFKIETRENFEKLNKRVDGIEYETKTVHNKLNILAEEYGRHELEIRNLTKAFLAS